MNKNLTADIADLNARFRGLNDGWLDSFRILDDHTGPLIGDCDDYACTALWHVANHSMTKFWWLLLTGQARIWRSYSVNGEPHAVLWVKGLGYIDNLTKVWAEMTPHTLRRTRPVGVVAIKMLVGVVVK